MKNLLLSIIFLSVVLSACKVSKDIQTPVPEIPKIFRGDSLKKDSISLADLPVKDFFTDPLLQTLIDSALLKNYDLQIALNNVQSSNLLLKQVKWNYLPEVGLNVTANTQRPSDNSLTGISLSQYGFASKHIEDYSANVALSWEADIWGKIGNMQRKELAGYLQSVEARKAIETEIVSSVSQGYYNLLMLNEQLLIARTNAKLNDSTLRIVQLQFNAGQVTSLAVQQTMAQKQAAMALIPQFEKNIVIQENALRIMAGQLPDAISGFPTLDRIHYPDGISTGIPASMVHRRPDVVRAELALTIANANSGISKAEMYPALRISASGGVNSFMANNWFNIPASLFGIVAGSIGQPLFQHKELRTAYQVSEVQRAKTVLEFRQAVLNAVGEVSDALVKIEKLKEQQRIAADRVQTLKTATKNANLLFTNGMANYLEVITAQTNVLQSELELASLKRDELSAYSLLYKSLGGGWK